MAVVVTGQVCPVCEDETLHEVLKTRGRERVVRCRTCDHVHPVVEPREIAVPIHVSKGEETTRAEVEVPEDVRISVGDRFLAGGGLAEVTAVEDEDGGRPEALVADEIEAIWAKDVREVPVDVTIHRGRRSTAHQVVLGSAEELVVGDRWTVDGEEVRIDRIKTDDGIERHRGTVVPAGAIVRVYAYPEGADRD